MAKKSNHPGRISQEKIEAVYLDWVDGMSLDKLHEKHNISARTIMKYRDGDNWAKRREKVQSVVAKKLDKTAATRKARRARLGVRLQAEGLKTIGKGIKKASDAINALKLGAEFEDQAYGEVDESMTITIKIPKGMAIGNRPIEFISDHQ